MANPISGTAPVSDGAAQPQRLQRVCADFEALFIARMLSEMRRDDDEGDESAGLTLGGANPLQDVMDWELSRVLARRSPFHIAELLQNRFSPGQPNGQGDAAEEADLDAAVNQAAGETGLDPQLLRAVIACESGGDAEALSSKGAMGLMQLMPDTARSVGVVRPFDPQENVRGGAEYLKRMLDRYQGNLTLSLAAYNAGPGAVDRYGGVPPFAETRSYVHRVLEKYAAGAGDKVPLPASNTSRGVADE